MRRKRFLKWLPLILLGIAAFIFIGGFVVMYLWNWLLPALFGWKMITFWQALGLLALCRILFGGFGKGHHGSGRRRAWEKMTPEERERFRHRFGTDWGSTPPPASAPSA
jgi:hypothetical protein